MRQIILFGVLTGFLVIGCDSQEAVKQAAKKESISEKNSLEKAEVQRDMFGLPVDSMAVTDYTVKRNESLYLILDKLDFSPQKIYSITQQARKVLDIDNLKPGQQYRTYTSSDSTSDIARMVWQPNKLEYVVFDGLQDSLEIYRAARPLTNKLALASGSVSSSLYQTISDEGASPLLAYKLANIFAWQIDFFGLRDGDSFKVLYDKQYIRDDYFGIGDVLAAQFTHRGETYRAYKFTQGQTDGYFTRDGKSVEKALLKAPFEFSQRISSGFSKNRYHPILKERRPHHGIDYAAPHGTPVLSVGDGTITRARYDNGNGYFVKIKHNGTYETAYMHLSDFANGIREGVTVEQGQVIAYVGSTGLSTGPHLHYTLYKNNRPVNALAIDLPSSASVPDSLMDEFKKVRDSLDQQLRKQNEEASQQSDKVLTQAR